MVCPCQLGKKKKKSKKGYLGKKLKWKDVLKRYLKKHPESKGHIFPIR